MADKWQTQWDVNQSISKSKGDAKVPANGTLEVKGAVRLRWENQNMRWQQFLPWTHVPARGTVPLPLVTSPSSKERTQIPEGFLGKQRRRKGTPNRDQLNTLKSSMEEETPETDIHQEPLTLGDQLHFGKTNELSWWMNKGMLMLCPFELEQGGICTYYQHQ